jgi:hypothetical protein
MQLAYSLDATRLADFSAIATAARAAGFDAVEITQATADACAPLKSAPAMPIACLAAAGGFSNQPAADAAATAAITALIDQATALACPVVSVGETIPMQSGDIGSLIAPRATWLAPLAAYAQRRGVKLAYTNSDTISTGADLWKLCETVSSPTLGVCWHSRKALQVRGLALARALSQSPNIVVPMLNTRIVHARWNWPTDIGPNSPLQMLAQRLSGIGYRGSIAVEGIAPETPASELSDIAKTLRKAMAVGN